VDLLNRVTGNSPTFHGNVSLVGDIDFNSSMRMPEFRGRLETGEFMLAGRRLVEFSKGDVELVSDEVHVPHLEAKYAGGPVDVYGVVIEPFEPGIPLRSERVSGSNVAFPTMIRDLAITPNTIVQWHLDRVDVTNFGGTLVPAKLDGDMHIETSEFEMFDRAYHSAGRQHMIGAKPRATLRGRFGVRDDSVQFNDVGIRFGKSHMQTTVHLGFSDWILVDVPEASIDLSEIGPLTTVPIQGTLSLSAKMDGEMSNPTLKGSLEIDDLIFAGYPLGDLRSEQTTFRPLWVELDKAELRKGKSTFRIPKGRLDFDKQASVRADLLVSSSGADVRDFLHMWHFDQDETWKELRGSLSTNSRVRYVLGGTDDPCGEGSLRVNGNARLKRLSLFDEDYDAGESDFDFRWRDVQASYHGMSLDLSNLHLEKGSGSLIGSLTISEGAKVHGNLIATAIPIDRLRGMGDVGKMLSGTVSAIAHVGGSLDSLESQVRANVSPVMLGRSRLPASKLEIHLKPTQGNVAFAPNPSRCGNRIPLPPTTDDIAKDKANGVFHISGHLFGQQVMFDKFSITRQRQKIAKGGILFNELNLGPLLDLRQEVGMAKQRPAGKLSGRVDLARLPIDHPAGTQAVAEVGTLWVSWKGFRMSAEPLDELTLAGGALSAPKLTLKVATPAGREATFDVTGGIEEIGSNPQMDMEVRLKPVELKNWAMLVPSVRRVSGRFGGHVKLTGPLSKPRQSGALSLTGGQFVLKRNKLAFNEVDVEVALNSNGIVLERAEAEVGGGSLRARGRAPMSGLEIGDFRGQIVAKGVSIPVTDGVKLAIDADLESIWQRSNQADQEEPLPKLSGVVTVRDFEYSRPVTMNADISSLTRKGKRSQFESYDPTKDVVDLDVTVRSDQALRLDNNLINANLRIEQPGLQLTGTNQRFGLRGTMRVEPGGRIRLRRNEFEVQSGEVRFDDPTTIAPRVDVRAVTEYRRYSSSATAASPGEGATSSAAAASTSGQWRIAMHAHGDAENLKIDLTSQPKLSQDDIFLLLTVGLTRAELDQAQSASLGESVALEALGSLTGADSAVNEAIPVIDEFRFGSSYSSRTGRTEPTVTVGKRLTERIRAFVTSGISESREVRSNLEWRLNRQLSVEGSYDNVNDISSSNLGNLGADVRWRLEFR
jgi:translocation and assembly module TamB